MKDFDLYTSKSRRIAISFLCLFFITYPNVMWIPWNIANLTPDARIIFWCSFGFRCVFFFFLFYYQIGFNVRRITDYGFVGRFWRNILFSLAAGMVFFAVSYFVPLFAVQSGSVAKHLTFQFLVVSLLCTFIGYIYDLNNARRQKEMLIERLKIENLQSRCNALVNQINPHFFFNSLNGISSLVRKGDDDNTLEYVSQLSDIFRYILQSDRRQMVSLEEEINFVEAFSHVMEVRFGGKLRFETNITDEHKNLRLPVLSLLPLLENVTVHNRIDSDHKMTVTVRSDKDNTVVVENPIFPKNCPPDTNGTGLDNLHNRFRLLTGKEIIVESDNNIFRVTLPLTR